MQFTSFQRGTEDKLDNKISFIGDIYLHVAQQQNVTHVLNMAKSVIKKAIGWKVNTSST